MTETRSGVDLLLGTPKPPQNGNGATGSDVRVADEPSSHLVLIGRTTGARTEPPRRTGDFGFVELALLVTSVLSAFAVVWVFFYQLTLLSGAFGFALCWYACFLLIYWIVTLLTIDRSAATDRVVTTVMFSAAAIAIGLLLYVVGYVVVKGIRYVSWSFLTKTMAFYQPADPHLFGHIGVFQAIVGTFEEVAIAALIAVPLAFLTAIFLNEVGGPGTKFVRTIVTAMSGVPSIVAGVFIFAIFIVPHVLHYSGIAASLALFVLMLPSVTRTTEEVLRVVPGGLREASLALGASEWRTVRQVVLPTARSGLITAVVLGVAIAAGETAPLIFTSFGANHLNANPLSGPQGSLPLVVLQNITQPQAPVLQLAFTTAFVLVAIVLVLFVIARVFGRRRTKRGPVRRFLTAQTERIRSR